MHEAFHPHPEIAERFADLHPPFAPQSAVIEANRCLNCFDAPCTSACPTHIDVPRFIKKIASGNLRGSARTILDANILGASCSRVCPVSVLCEGACVMHHYNETPIAIGRLQRHAIDDFHARGGKLSVEAAPRLEKIACIGSGPASLACAAELRLRGFQVTVFDRKALPGGLNTYGVAEYKLRTADSLREIEMISSLGVEFVTREIADEEDLAQLEGEFDKIFLGVGLGAMRRLNLAGEEHPRVMDALEFIAAYKTGSMYSIRGNVVVVGAGNTAIDAANAAKRLGANEVHIVYRRDEGDISAFDFEYEHARMTGVRFWWKAQPVSLRFEEGRLAGVELVRVELDEAGAFRPLPASDFEIECDFLIPAIGQSPLIDFLQRRRGLELQDGRVAIERATGQTTLPQYFAGGDCVNGGREVVDAVADGKRAAIGIADALIREKAYA